MKTRWWLRSGKAAPEAVAWGSAGKLEPPLPRGLGATCQTQLRVILKEPEHKQWGPTAWHRQRRRWHPTPALLPGKSHGQRSLVGCSPWGQEESDTTERLHFHFSLSCIGEGNGNPLQCSCLENSRDGRAWWAAICGVAQSRTRLKWLSSSSKKHKRAGEKGRIEEE